MHQPKVLDANQVLRELERMLRRLIGENIELILNLDNDACFVRADSTHLEQIFLNLAINSRDAMPHGGKLTIETRQILKTAANDEIAEAPPDAKVMFAVKDTGTGMPQEVLPRIFEPFFTTKEVGQGTGLGLAVTYNLVRQYGGDIHVRSQEGEGTTALIYLPCAGAQLLDLPTKTEIQHRFYQNKTALLIEDEESVRDLVAQILLASGFQVITAPDGEKALSLLKDSSISLDLLITDVVMPGKYNGRETVQKIAPLYPDLQILYMSGYTDDIILRHGISQQEVAFLPKPFTPDELLTKVEGLVQR
ncbi:response regulator [Chloroflexi bacterium TSY]|nr:response regulator [Chloroflexi bacterium TSY]